MRRFLMLSGLVALALSTSGCLTSRTIYRLPSAVQLSSDKNVTLINTQDVYSVAFLWPVRVVDQYWHCTEAPGQINCKKACDGKTDLTCPSFSLAGASVSSFR